MTDLKRFEELLDAYRDAVNEQRLQRCVDTRSALVAFVRERLDMPADLAARIERQRLRYEAEHDVPMTFGDTVRMLLEKEREDDDE